MDKPYTKPAAGPGPQSGARPGTSRPNRRRIAGERTTGRRAPQPARDQAPAPATGPTQDPAPVLTLPPRDERPAPTEAPTAAPTGSDRRRGAGPSNLVLAVLAVVAAALIGTAAYVAVPAWHDRGVQQAQRSAPSVAERAAKALLSYDYRTLSRDESAAASYLTPSYRAKYRHTFDRGVKPSAPRLQAKVTAQVLGSGIAQADADHAHVLLFVDQTTRSKANPGRPQVALNRVMLDMVRRGGTWLVNGITSY